MALLAGRRAERMEHVWGEDLRKPLPRGAQATSSLRLEPGGG